MKIKSKALGEAEKVYEGIYSFRFDEENNLYTARDLKMDKDTKEIESYSLYIGDKMISEDVKGLGWEADDGTTFFRSEYSDKHNTSKLNIFDGKKVIPVADDVYASKAYSENQVFFIDDYDDGEGTLKLWTGAKDKVVEIDDASSFVNCNVVEKK